MEERCNFCPVTNKDQQDAVIDATIKAAYLDPYSPTSLRAITSMLPAWLRADHKRVGRRLKRLISTGAVPRLKGHCGKDGKVRIARRICAANVPDDFSPKISLHCGDSLQVLARLHDDSIDCCVTSPPYYRQMDVNADGQIGQEETVHQYVNNLVAVFDQVRRMLRRTGTLWIVIADSYKDGQSLLVPQRLALALADRAWKLRAEIVLQKSNPAPYRYQGRISPTHETLLMFSLGIPHYLASEDLANRGTVWQVAPIRDSVGGHPAPMSMQLVTDCVTAGCHPGGTVLDPFCGIGTTLVACAENYRHGIGVELSPYYFHLAQRRLPRLVAI